MVPHPITQHGPIWEKFEKGRTSLTLCGGKIKGRRAGLFVTFRSEADLEFRA